jgi:integrase
MHKLTLQNKKGRIACQFRVAGQRYSLLGLGNWDSGSDKAKAEALLRVIECDILEHRFDETLQRYKQGLSKAAKALSSPVEMFARWMEEVKPNARNYAVHYDPVARVLFGHSVHSFTKLDPKHYWSELSSRTYNDRIGVLRRFGDWLVREGYFSRSPYMALKNSAKVAARVEVFTAIEVTRIIGALATRSLMVAAYYQFLFLTGCRSGEALALLSDDVDVERSVVTIKASLARGVNSETSSAHRTRKATKTGDTRYLPLSGELLACIALSVQHKAQYCISSPYVFCNAKGEPLDDTNLLKRYWKPTLEALGIPYRKPYTTRHTAASTVIENGGTLADAAKLLGHRDLRMVSTTYGHAIKGVQLPSYS